MGIGAGSVRHFIYPLNEGAGYSFDDDGRVPITPDNFWRFALKGETTLWELTTGYRLVAPGDWMWAYFARPIGYIYGVGIVRTPTGYRSDWN